MNRNIEFHPTLVIGLGGTGHGILLKLKKRFIDQFGKVPPIIQFLAIDTTQEAQRQDTSSDGKTDVELEPNNEQVIITAKEANNLLKGKNPHINDWWPSGTRVLTINSGSQQIRALGRLALFAHYKDVRRRIQEKLDQVREIGNKNLMKKEGYTVSERRGVDVYIVTSLAGGTGSGMFLDVAFITRNIVSSSTITGVFVLSRIFDKLPGTDLVKTNTYAALKEIEALSKLRENESIEVNYGINKIVISQPPYDMIYITDNINEAETVIDNYKTLHSQIADGIYLMVGSEIGADSDNRFNNIRPQVATSGLIENRSTGYCSFGVSSCTWKFRGVKSRVINAKNASTRKLVEALLGSSASNESVKTDLITLNQQCNIGEDRIKELLAEIGLSIKTEPESFAARRELIRHSDNALSILKAEHTDFLAKVESRAKETAKDNCDRLRGQFLNNIDLLRKKSLSRPDFLSYLSNFSHQLEQAIDSTKKELERRRKNADREAQAIQFGEVTQSSGGAQTGIVKLLIKIREFFSRRSPDTDHATIFANKADQHRKLITKAIYCAEAINLLNEVLIVVKGIAAKSGEFRLRLEEIQDRLKLEGEKKVERETLEENPFIRVLPNYPDVNQKDISLFRFADWCEEQSLSIDTLMRSSGNELARIIGGYIDEEYKDEREISIDAVLEDEQNKRVIENEGLLNYLSQVAAPLWLYTKTEIPLERDQVTKLAYCGVPNSELPPLKRLKGGWQGGTAPLLISTIDQHRITFFNITYGVPLFALAGLKEMKEEYKKKRRPTCHLHREWFDKLPDLFPSQLDNPLICFTLAQAPGFELIRRNGNGTYAVYLGQHRPKVLADELEDSFNKFKERDDEREEVMRAITKILNEQDRLKARESLVEYMKQLGSLKANNGLSRSSIQFMKKQIKAIEEYLRDF
jgi:hypothetical protein